MGRDCWENDVLIQAIFRGMNMKESEKEGLRPLVSIGIPTYNRAFGLKRTLECMLHQSYENLEIIVSDNASPDPKVRDIAEKYAERDSRVRYFKQSQNKGPHFNFNYVLEKASGEYFMWAADDDEWIYSFIETCIDEFMRLGPAFVAVALLSQNRNRPRLPQRVFGTPIRSSFPHWPTRPAF